MSRSRLATEFYARSARTVAQALLGKELVRYHKGCRLSGRIVETEAYCDNDAPDLACHAEKANRGRPTLRTAVMFGPAGYAYVYFAYGLHWLFNVVTGQPGQPNGVLIRALEPRDGLAEMKKRRGERPLHQLTNGPAKLTQALAIDRSLNEANLCLPESVIWIEEAANIPLDLIASGPRVGLGQTPEPWLSMPWRYWLRDNKYVSK